MHKFDLHSYFFLKEIQNSNEEDPNQDNDPNAGQGVPVPGQAPLKNPQAPQQNAGPGGAPPQSDEVLKSKSKQENTDAFQPFVGSTISDIKFNKNGGNGGEIMISISKSNMPLKISWAGDKVTVTQPNGNIVSL